MDDAAPALLRVAVARVDGVADAHDDAAPAWMDAAQRLRRAGLSPAARRAFTASRWLLRELLQSATGLPADAWDVSAPAGRAPVARATRGGPGIKALHASLSHRGGWIAAAVSDAPVGVDVEGEQAPRSDPAERARLMLSRAELDAWSALPPSGRESGLLSRWAVKEAWYKASPPEAAPWDFRRIVACGCSAGEGRANVRSWTASPVHLALCCADARALAAVECDGLAAAAGAFWHVRRVLEPGVR